MVQWILFKIQSFTHSKSFKINIAEKHQYLSRKLKERKEILLQIKKSVKEIEPKSEIILYGSRARGDERQDSDWDLLILVPYPAGIKEEQKFRHKLFDVELKFGQAISTLVKYKNEWESKFTFTPLYQNIAQEGITL